MLTAAGFRFPSLLARIVNQMSTGPPGITSDFPHPPISAHALKINHKSVMSNIQDPEDRGTMIFAWWMAVISDAYSSAYYRRKPFL
jgi:hypothetical protein